jgi:superfamily II DNA or RNA helicase
MPSASEFRTKLLSRRRAADDYDVYRAALECDLTDPIVIKDLADLKSRPRWRERLTPYPHQLESLLSFCRRLPAMLLADEAGLGKTVSAGLIMSELSCRGRLLKALIVCPKPLCLQWKEELAAKFEIKAEIATGHALLDAVPDEIGAVITTYDSASLHLDQLPADRFEMLVLDEAHKLRNLYGTRDPPHAAQPLRTALEDRRFRFVLMLTAKPIQDRLWDIYALVDLLAAARGHANPFGKEGTFARKFIADGKRTARELTVEGEAEFRSIVHSTLSRVRRADARLNFPDRQIQMRKVNPTGAELALIDVVAKHLQAMDRPAQIALLQALASSPDALAAELDVMAQARSAPRELAQAVGTTVATIPPGAKLEGLAKLVERLKAQNPDRWRVAIFTTHRATQANIRTFLAQQGVSVGIVTGEEAAQDQATLASFQNTPPGCNVIVATDAGSAGLDLHAANVLVNFDLPWNPHLLEQRIGRVQRLAAEHARVSILNIMLRGTFEETIVGRLAEKLQSAARTTDDIAALVQDFDAGDGDDAPAFEDRVLSLVLTALAGADTADALRLIEQYIQDARAERERQESVIDEMFGSKDGTDYVGPRAPNLPARTQSVDAQAFAQAALPMLGATATPIDDPSSPAFRRLVKRVVAAGLHDVEDADPDAAEASERAARAWAERFGATLTGIEIREVRRAFSGTALLRVRASVAHDSFERIVACDCSPARHMRSGPPADIAPLPAGIVNPATLGIDTTELQAEGGRDAAIAEFCRFYLERRYEEVRSAGSDDARCEQRWDDFTPRIDMTLVGLQGSMAREVTLQAAYGFEGQGKHQGKLEGDYTSEIVVRPRDGSVLAEPPVEPCGHTGRLLPADCLTACDVTGTRALHHLLQRSERSGRLALPDFVLTCAVSGRRLIIDELTTSDATGKPVDPELLQASSISGRRAEPDQVDTCAFTHVLALKDELATSEISAKLFRKDQLGRCAVSGRAGHRDEFIACAETHATIELAESERCEITGQRVRKGLLEVCPETKARALPSEFENCSVTGKRVLKRLLVNSSVSQAPLLRRAAVRSMDGAFCLPAEAATCFWSGRAVHPDDIRTCTLTGLQIHAEFATAGDHRLKPLVALMDGVTRTADEEKAWQDVTRRVSTALKGKPCRIEAATLSPTRRHLATCAEVKTMFGLRVRQAAAIVELSDGSVVGRIAEGRRGERVWEAGG